jgi:hypothetical protein
MGRPTDYTEELAADICARLAEGQPLVKICGGDDMPATSTVYRWLNTHEDFRRLYTMAREDQADTIADEILKIADDTTGDTVVDEDGKATTNWENVQRSKLRVDARKWLASKLKAKKYGDKVQVGGAEDLPPIEMTPEDQFDTARRIAFLLRMADLKLDQKPPLLLLPAPTRDLIAETYFPRSTDALESDA